MPNRRTIDDLATIRAVLEKRAKAGETITYGEAAALVGRLARGLNPILDAIKTEEAERGRPDLGCLVVNARTRFPGNVGRGDTDRQSARALRQAVFQAWKF